MGAEAINFAAFMALAFGGHKLGEFLESHPNFCPKLRSKGAGRIAGVSTMVLLHPGMREAVKEYMVHFVVYSGYVLGHH